MFCINLILKLFPLPNLGRYPRRLCPFDLTFENESNDTVNFDWEFGPGSEILVDGASPVVLFTEPGTYEVILTITDTICGLTDTALKIITVYEELELEVPNDTIVCTSGSFELIANSNGSATSFIWSEDPDFGTMLNDDIMDSVITVNPVTTTTYYITASNGWALCDLIDSVTITFLEAAIEVLAIRPFVCPILLCSWLKIYFLIWLLILIGRQMLIFCQKLGLCNGASSKFDVVLSNRRNGFRMYFVRFGLGGS